MTFLPVRRWRRAPLAVAAILLLAACTGDSEPTSSGGGTARLSDQATSTTQAPPPRTTATTRAPDQQSSFNLVLDPRGFNVAAFGDPAGAVVRTLTRRLGKPTRDSGWQPRGTVHGVCPGDQTRVVTWGALDVLLSTGPTSYGPAGTQHFFGYGAAGDRIGPVRVATAAGIAVGSTVADLQAAYPGRVRMAPASDPQPASFVVGRLERPSFYGQLTGTGAGGRIVLLQAGDPCGE